jgi:hypothetical protein
MSLEDFEANIPTTRRSIVLITKAPGQGIVYMNFKLPQKLIKRLFANTISIGIPENYFYGKVPNKKFYWGRYIRFPGVKETPYQWFVGKLKSYGLVVWEERR